MDLIRVVETRTGRLLDTLPASAWSWRRCVSGSEALSVTVPLTQDTESMDLRGLLTPWRTSLAVVDSATSRVLAAGPVYARSWDADALSLSVSCCGMWDLLKRRLVLAPALDSYASGAVTGVDGVYPSPWTQTMTGSLAGLARSLVEQSLRAGALPVVLPPVQSGLSVRTFHGPDLATVESRLSELTQVVGGPEVIFQPRLVDGSTSLSWHMLVGSPELVVAEHSWDARRRAVPLVDLAVEEDASDMVGDSWARGGSQDDQTLMAHWHDRWLEDAGWPLLQGADTSHSSVSDLATLRDYARTATVMRSRSTEVVRARVRRTDEAGYALGDALTPGDHVALLHEDPYLGSGVVDLKVLELSGDEGEWVTASCREVMDQTGGA